jgi:hypothetical protein
MSWRSRTRHGAEGGPRTRRNEVDATDCLPGRGLATDDDIARTAPVVAAHRPRPTAPDPASGIPLIDGASRDRHEKIDTNGKLTREDRLTVRRCHPPIDVGDGLRHPCRRP